jgi:xylulokinase
VSLTCGTTDNLAVCVDAPRFDRRFVTSAHVVPNRWLLIGTMSSTGGALEWSARLLQYAKEATGVPYDDLFAAACEVRAGSEGVIFLPYLQGERSPVWDPAARGVLSGLTLATSPQHLIRAVLEGCAFALRQNVEISEEILGRRIPALKIVGGGTRSDVWNAIKANVLQKPLHRVSMRETSLLGAAMLAAICAGASASPEAAARAMQARISAPPILPDPAHRKIYDSRYRRYLRLYPSLRTVFPISP